MSATTNSPQALEWARARKARLEASKAASDQRITDQQVAWKSAHDEAEQLRSTALEQIAEHEARIEGLRKDLERDLRKSDRARAAAITALLEKEKVPAREVAILLDIDEAQVRRARSTTRKTRRGSQDTSPASVNTNEEHRINEPAPPPASDEQAGPAQEIAS